MYRGWGRKCSWNISCRTFRLSFCLQNRTRMWEALWNCWLGPYQILVAWTWFSRIHSTSSLGWDVARGKVLGNLVCASQFPTGEAELGQLPPLSGDKLLGSWPLPAPPLLFHCSPSHPGSEVGGACLSLEPRWHPKTELLHCLLPWTGLSLWALSPVLLWHLPLLSRLLPLLWICGYRPWQPQEPLLWQLLGELVF